MSATRAAEAGRNPAPVAIVPGIWRVGGGSWGGVTRCISSEGDANVYLLELDGARVLVDAGTLDGSTAVEENVRAAGSDPSALTDVLLTHSHWDHTGAVARWQRVAGARTHLSAVGAEFLARGDHRLVGYQLHGPRYAFEPFHVDHALADGERFRLGSVDLTASAVPGHSPDSTLCTFAHGGERIAIGGDVVFGPRSGTTFVLGQLCSLWLSDLDAYVRSLRRMDELTIDCLLPGHGDPILGRARVREAIRATLALAQSLAEDGDVRRNVGV
jgi:glyoxylase-like metal-dependent hydrolase (beta-lactamase superfamily II)